VPEVIVPKVVRIARLKVDPCKHIDTLAARCGEFKTEGGCQSWGFRNVEVAFRESHESLFRATIQDASIGMVTKIVPSDFASDALLVQNLLSIWFDLIGKEVERSFYALFTPEFVNVLKGYLFWCTI